MKNITPLLIVLTGLTSPALASQFSIDDFSYGDHAAAREAWQAQAGSLPVEMADSGTWGNERVMKLPCDFTVRGDRSYWDREVSLDLSGYSEFSLEVFAEDPGAFAAFTLYFHSGGGWYSSGVQIDKNGWQVLRFPKWSFHTEGTPAGWGAIDRIRLSPWKQASRDTYLALRELWAFTPLVLLVLDTHTSDSKTAQATTAGLLEWLLRYDVSAGVIRDDDLAEGYLTGASMAILPYNDSLSDSALASIEQFVSGGGKLMDFYILPERVAQLLGIRRTGYTPGNFAAYRFQDDVIENLPERVEQASWNITVAEPTGSLNSRVIAEWEDERGKMTGYPAWLASDNGLFMSHIMLGDDAEAKQYMLLVLIGHYVPEIWPDAASAAYDQIGRVGDYTDYEDAVAGIRASAASTPRVEEVELELAAADDARNLALAGLNSGEYTGVVLAAREAGRHLKEAYYLCQSPKLPEFRAVWEHGGTGPYPGDWDAAISVLAENNFTAVFPNMSWAGLAHYDSSLLPHSKEFEELGDQLDACITAAHAKGIEVHAWKVNWNLSRAPKEFVDAMRAEGRTQVNRYGEPVDWLCPSHPDNFALERDSMLEVVRNYDVDGIHFDYIRYPNQDNCYCDGCRRRFQEQTGISVPDWPADVLEGGQYESEFLQWRRGQITRLVSAVYQGVKALKPWVKVSAAVFSNYTFCKDGVGQDWVDWIDKGIVDFLCPMDYTNDFEHFRDLVTEQLAYAAGRIPIYPGIGAGASSSSFGPDGVVAQVLITRELDTGGFILFNYNKDLAEHHLPALGKGLTSDPVKGDRESGTEKEGGDLMESELGADAVAEPEGALELDSDGEIMEITKTDVDELDHEGYGETSKHGAVSDGCGCSAGTGKPFGLLWLLVLGSTLVLRQRPPITPAAGDK